MIKSFGSKAAKDVFSRLFVASLPRDIQRTALRKLWMIDAAISINDLRVPPANRLEKLKGERRGQCSIRINKQWRICFAWKDNNAYEVEIVDYH